MLKVAVFNFKGGTGKSTTTLNLGASLATSKRKVLVIDLDGQRTLSFGLGKDGDSPTALNWLGDEEIRPLAKLRRIYITLTKSPLFLNFLLQLIVKSP